MRDDSSDDFDPYEPRKTPVARRRHDPFRIMSRERWPAEKGRHAMPIRPRARPSDRELPDAGESSSERGVWEERAPFPGLRSFAVRGDEGERLAEVTAIAEIVDEAFLLGLERLLERYRPRPTLRVI